MQKDLDSAKLKVQGTKKCDLCIFIFAIRAQKWKFWEKRTYGVHPDDIWQLTPHAQHLYNVKCEGKTYITLKVSHWSKHFATSKQTSLHACSVGWFENFSSFFRSLFGIVCPSWRSFRNSYPCNHSRSFFESFPSRTVTYTPVHIHSAIRDARGPPLVINFLRIYMHFSRARIVPVGNGRFIVSTMHVARQADTSDKLSRLHLEKESRRETG